MDWYLDLWTKQPMKASVLMEILLLLIVAGILTCFILIRWRRVCRKGKDRERALDEVLTELVDEPVQNLTELRNNIRKDFRK
nr:hypothetical protein [uncultured Anaerotignum sp.]